jgi:hypothetical protein
MNILEYKKRNPKIFWGIVAAIVVIITLAVGLEVGLKSPAPVAPEPAKAPVPNKTLNERAAEIINKPTTVVEKFEDGSIICSNPRNENYEKAILLFLDIFENKENNELLSYSTTNFIVKDGDKIIMDLKEEKEKQNFAISELSKIRKLMNTLDKRFGKKANYVHLFFIIKEYLMNLVGQPKDNLDEKQKLKFIDIFAPVFLFIIILLPFKYYISNEVDWSEEIFTYKNNKLEFNSEKIKNNENYKISEIKFFGDDYVGKSIIEIIKMLLDKRESNIPKTLSKMTLNKTDYENEDFINTFNSSNACIKSSDKQYYNKTFKYSYMFKTDMTRI